MTSGNGDGAGVSARHHRAPDRAGVRSESPRYRVEYEPLAQPGAQIAGGNLHDVGGHERIVAGAQDSFEKRFAALARALAGYVADLAEKRTQRCGREPFVEECRGARRTHERREGGAQIAACAIRRVQRRVVELPNAPRDARDRATAERERAAVVRRKGTAGEEVHRSGEIGIAERRQVFGEQCRLLELPARCRNRSRGGCEGFYGKSTR